MNPKKLTFLASLGAGLEYYDFIIYGLLTSYLSKAFFPPSNHVTALLATFAIFALGYVIRPLGGILLGSVGDCFGRRMVFLISLALMAIATFAIGCLPVYASCGLLAPCLLIVVRLIQGITFSAEIPGLVTFLVEHIQKRERSCFIGFALSSLGLGSALGSAVVFFLNKVLTPEQMADYGWRLPFMLGGLLALISYGIRKKIAETPVFLSYQHVERQQKPITILLQQYYPQVALAFVFTLCSACLVMFGVALPSFLHQFYQFPLEQVYFWNTIGLLWTVIMLPCFGWVAMQFGRLRLLVTTLLVVILISYNLFQLLALRQTWSLVVFMLLYNTLISALANTYLPLLSQLFPTKVRLTGAAFSYNLIYCLASFTPLFLAKVAAVVGGSQLSYLFFIVLACLSLLGLYLVKNKLLFELEVK